MFTENETNNERIFGTPNASRYVKDGINSYVVQGNHHSVNPEKTGMKSAGTLSIDCGCRTDSHHPSEAKQSGRLRPWATPFKSFAQIMQIRQREVR